MSSKNRKKELDNINDPIFVNLDQRVKEKGWKYISAFSGVINKSRRILYGDLTNNILSLVIPVSREQILNPPPTLSWMKYVYRRIDLENILDLGPVINIYFFDSERERLREADPTKEPIRSWQIDNELSGYPLIFQFANGKFLMFALKAVCDDPMNVGPIWNDDQSEDFLVRNSLS